MLNLDGQEREKERERELSKNYCHNYFYYDYDYNYYIMMRPFRWDLSWTFNSLMESSRFGEHLCSSLIESIYIAHYYIYDYLSSFGLGSSIEKKIK